MTKEEIIQDAKKKFEQLRNEVNNFWDPQITRIDYNIGNLQANGLDPAWHFDANYGSWMNYYKERDLLIKQRDETIHLAEMELATLINSFDETTPPAEGEGEEGLFKAVTIIVEAAIMSVIDNGVQITIGSVKFDSKTPLGGEGSIVDNVRQTLYRSLGLPEGDPFIKLIENPLSKEWSDQLAGNIKDSVDTALTDSKREMDKALTDAKREMDKALTEIKASLDKELADAMRVISKGFSDIKREYDNARKTYNRTIGKLVPRVTIGGFKL